jgi:hypothetical protein
MWPFKFKPAPLPTIPDIVDTVFANHPPECIFAPGARDRIIEYAQHYHGETLINALERGFKSEEIYCPHEGIDRRAEFGLC